MAGKRQKKGSAGSGAESAATSPASAGAPSSSIPDYGLDSPLRTRQTFSRGAWMLALGLFVWYMNHVEYPGPALTLLLVFVALSVVSLAAGLQMLSSSRKGKLALRDRLLDELALQGDEKILDAGCGRGLIAIGAAKHLTSGKVTAVDAWDATALSGNSGDAARENAKLEGVADRLRIENGDIRKLTYPSGGFDVVVSVNTIHHMPDEPDRDQAVRELFRMAKPGGKILISDIANLKRYEEILQECGATNLVTKSQGILWCRPARSVLASK